MKFVCHITIADTTHARITFAVMQLDNCVFEVSPVQNKLPSNNLLYPVITLTRNENNWEYKFENDRNWIGEECLDQFFMKLDQKLAEPKFAGLSIKI